jgi:hypothetical protein
VYATSFKVLDAPRGTLEEVVADTATSTVAGHGGTVAQPAPATAHESEHFNGRAVSWVGVGITIAGFVVGWPAFVPHPTWWLLWVAIGIVALGGIILIGAKTFSEDWY